MLPSHSYYSARTTALSCLVRGMGEQSFSHVANMTDEVELGKALSRERCEVVCTQVCQTVCTHAHLDVHQLFPTLNDWKFDPNIELNPRQFVS